MKKLILVTMLFNIVLLSYGKKYCITKETTHIFLGHKWTTTSTYCFEYKGTERIGSNVKGDLLLQASTTDFFKLNKITNLSLENPESYLCRDEDENEFIIKVKIGNYEIDTENKKIPLEFSINTVNN